MDISVRDVEADDAEAIVAIMNPIIEARCYTAFTEPFTVDGERDYIAKFSPRGVWKVAVRQADNRVDGCYVDEILIEKALGIQQESP